ncbi:MAG: ribosome silencing factor [Ignavibacteria bacterium GWF2_33_9]|nr:MAG: ribosome silencing factor [Ignavibacteria bacterium GWF2_33_9]
MKPRSSKTLAINIAKIASEKLASTILILELKNVESAPADYFVICSTHSQPQTKSVFDEIYYQIKNLGITLPKIEGLDSLDWILLDYFDVVVHVMTEEARNFYKLEKLWSDAKFFTLDEENKPISFKRENLKKMFSAPTV